VNRSRRAGRVGCPTKTPAVTRVIAGAARGRRLAVPAGRLTRPTSDRAREGLFGTLLALHGPLDGACVLDLYAGSGAVGLEALSRGARRALFVEADARAARVIRGNIDTLGLTGGGTGHRPGGPAARPRAGRAGPLRRGRGRPPYAVTGDEVTGMLAALAGGGWLAPGAVVAVERATRSGPVGWPPGYAADRFEALRRYDVLVRSRRRRPVGGRTVMGSADVVMEGRDRVRRVVCPGSFDPVTNGHLDIISRAALLHDEVIVVVGANQSKHGLFTVEERVEMLREVTSGLKNVEVATFRGLLVQYCRDNGISAIVKGLRAVSDFEYEMEMAQMNYRLAEIETLFIAANPVYSFLRSSLVKEICRYGGDVSSLVPELVFERLQERLGSS